MNDPIVVEREVLIARPQETVFGYVVDFRNDPKWRDEVARVEQPVPLRPGDMLTEYLLVSGVSLAVPLILSQWEPPLRAHVVTPPDLQHRLENTRTVQVTGANQSRLIYRLAFEREILRPVMADLPPSAEITAWFGGTVEQFLATLKKLLEE